MVVVCSVLCVACDCGFACVDGLVVVDLVCCFCFLVVNDLCVFFVVVVVCVCVCLFLCVFVCVCVCVCM